MMKKAALLCCVGVALVLSTTVAEAATFKTGRFLGNTVVGAQTFAHGLGEVPKAIIFWSSPGVGTASHYSFGLGVTDGTTSFCSSAGSMDAAATSDGSRGMLNKAICSMMWGEVTVAAADLTSWDATNVTINWTTNMGVTGYVNFVAIGGSEVSAKVVNWQAPTVTGNRNVTGIGFKPDVVIHGYSGSAVSALPPTVQASAHIGLGAMTANGNQWANMVRTLDALPTTETNRGQQTDSAIYMFGTGVSLLKEASFVSMNPDGFTVNFTTTDATASQVFSLALSGVSAKVGFFNKATAVGTQTIADVEFQPDVVLLTSVQTTAQAAPVNHARFGIGASDGTFETSTSLQDTHNLPTSSVDQMAKIDKVFLKVDNDTRTLEAEADLTGFINGGFTLGWTANDGAATQILYLALGQGSEAKVLTGSYRGDGTASHFIPVGFVPDFVIVKSGDTNATAGVFRSSTMSGSKPAIGASGLAANMITSIDPTGGGGFTVGSDGSVNSNACANGCLYQWTAFKAGAGKMAVGTYVGTGTAAPVKTITGLGFSPELVFVMSAGADEAIHESSASTNAKNFNESEFANVITLVSDGFSVPTTNARSNASGTTYHYVAWNAVAGEMVVGTYAGTAATQNITTVGFEAEYLYVHRQGAGAGFTAQTRPAALAQPAADGNLYFTATGYITTRILAMLSNGFTVGTQASSNASGATFTYYAWNRGSQPRIVTGDYTGNGAAQLIGGVGFQPDVVIVKQLSGTNRVGVIRTYAAVTPMANGKPMTGATGLTANTITAVNSDGFNIGTDNMVSAASVFHFIAFKAAPGSMVVGSYAGGGATSTSIRNLGFSPELVFILPAAGAAAVHHSSASASTFDFANGAGVGGLVTLGPDGFTVSTTNASVNASGQTYHYIAWNEIPGQMDVGSYGGNSVDSRTINSSTAATTAGLTFEPEYVIVKRSAQSAVHHTGSIGRTTDSSLYFSATGATPNANLIQELVRGGFEVGDGATALVNTNAQNYFYYAWKRPDPVSSGALTAVRLTAFDATRYDRGVLLKWRTGYEIDNLGFHVYRDVDGQRTRVTQSLVAGSGLMTARGAAVSGEHRYAIWDTALPLDRSAVYFLEDRAFNGKSTWHGPVRPADGGLEAPPNVTPSIALRDLGKSTGKDQDRRRVFLERGARLDPRDEPGPAGPVVSATEMQRTLAAGAAVKISVNRPGWYRITQPELVAAGLAPRAKDRTLRLFVDGVEQAIIVAGNADGLFGPTDAIEFYGTGVDTPYTDTRTYWLVADSRPGLRVRVQPRSGLHAPAIDAASFDFTVQQKERSIYFAALRNGEAENWFGQMVSNLPSDLVFDLPNIDAGAGAKIEMSIQGVSDDAGTDHVVAVAVNGTEIGELRFNSAGLGVDSFEIPPGTLTDGANTVTVTERGEEVFSLLDVVRVHYAHAYRADADLLRFTAAGTGTITVGGFASSAIRVIDITNPLAAEELHGTVTPDGGQSAVTVLSPGGGRTLLAFTESTVARPALVRANMPSRWHAATNRADYVAVTHAAFAGALDPLVERREQQGLSVLRADIEDIYDEFSFGQKTPQALKDFMVHARAGWTVPPRFLLLVGDATIDPRHYVESYVEADFVPTKLIALEGEKAELETASDDWFVDLDSNGLPDLAIGRLPVRTLDQANATVAKTLAYEMEADAPWLNEVTFVADVYDTQARNPYEAASRQLEALLPQAYTRHELFASELGAAGVKQALASQIAEGRVIVNYAGHGSTQLWGFNGGDLLDADDINGWSNSRLPFVIAMNCLNGLFQGIYDEESLAETLLRSPDGGAVAVWASSGLTNTAMQEVMTRELYRLIFQGGTATLGEMVAAAKRAASDPDVRRSWIFFGDPALRLRGIGAASTPSVPTVQTGTERDRSEPKRVGEPEVARDEPVAPVVRLGDFTGDGRDDLFLYDAERGAWTVAFSDADLRAVSGTLGAGLQVSAGRLNADAAADLVFYRAATGEWAEALNAGPGRFVVRASGTGVPNQQLLLADFTGEGLDDRLMYDPLTGTVAVTTHGTHGDVTEARRTWPTGVRLYAGDYNGDGLADVAGYDARVGSGFVALRTRNRLVPGTFNGGPAGSDGGLVAVKTRNDFVVIDTQWGAGWAVTPARLSDARRSDLVFYNAQTGAARVAVSDGRGGFTSRTYTWPAGLALQAADLEGDGREDLFGYSSQSGAWWTAAFSAHGVSESKGEWTPGWHAATGDLDGDGRTDVVLYDPLSGFGFRFHTVSPGVFEYRPESWRAGATLVGR